MEFEVSYTLDNEQQFWEELEDIISIPCNTHQLIDNALRSYLAFVSNYREEYLKSEYDVAKCSFKLLESHLFEDHKDYVRRQLLYGLLEDDDLNTLQFVVYFLLIDGRNDETTFEMMNGEGAFPRLVGLISSKKEEDRSLHKMLLELLYEMSRVQRLSSEDLETIDDAFVASLFDIVEELSNDVDDPYHYPIIRVLLVLNEQYMVLAHTTSPSSPAPYRPLTNKVLKHLSLHPSPPRTFGSNIILLLNREAETSLQLLILKFLYLLFTTPPTYEYFYTNDLRVLVDVIIRNLLDLPDDSAALRHTYLRVLCPLLQHTQLARNDEAHYKRDELRRLLTLLKGERSLHFAPVDPTTLRLVERCENVSWLATPATSPISPSQDRDNDGGSSANGVSPTIANNGTKGKPNGGKGKPKPPPPRSVAGVSAAAKKLLGMGLGGQAQESSLSVVEVAALKEKPGVVTPRRGVFNGKGSAEAVGGSKLVKERSAS